MKKLFLYKILFFGLLILSSCSNNDDDQSELSVIGGWTVSESRINGELFENPNIIRKLRPDKTVEFIYLINNGNDFDQRIAKGHWDKKGNILTIDLDSTFVGTFIYTIKELKSSSMIWESKNSENDIIVETLTR